MRIVVDLDGTICALKERDQTYEDVLPLPGAIETMQEWKKEGHEIIIYTARNMRTCAGNVGRVHKNVGSMTLNWLEKFEVPYDEIVFGKPSGDVYIDDLAIAFQSWAKVKARVKEGKP